MTNSVVIVSRKSVRESSDKKDNFLGFFCLLGFVKNGERTRLFRRFFSTLNLLLSNRTTSLRMDDYLSPSFELKCGLPQGLPLSPILYIIHNSNLLVNNSLTLDLNKISLGFIDDVTHFVADKRLENVV